MLALGEGPIHAIGDTPAGAPHLVFGEPIERGAIPGGLKVNGSEAFSASDFCEVRGGEIHQAPIQDWLNSYVALPVGGDLPSGVHYSYVTDGEHVSQIRARISFQGLFKQLSTGLSFYEVAFGWRYRRYDPVSPGPWISYDQFGPPTVGRNFRGTFTYSIAIDTYEPGQWELEVWRLTPDDNDSAHPETKDAQSTCVWSEVIEGSQLGAYSAPSYPGLALLSLDIQATERVNNPQPTVTVPVWGRRVAWWDEFLGWQDPAFVIAGTPDRWIGRNPAWILCDLLTSRRGGLGNWFSRDSLDIERIAEWAAWCEELVEGEPRCQCDIVVDAGRPAWEVIRNICRCGDAVPVLEGRRFSVRWEHARSRVQLFADSNLDGFQQTWIDTRTRPNLIDVQILNQEADWEQDLISVEDPSAIGTFEPWKLDAVPERRQTIQAPGVTRPSQARRMAAYQHNVNRLHDHVIRFRCGIDALAAEVGDVVGIETGVVRYFATETLGLRALTAADEPASEIQLDREVTLEPATTYQLVITDTDGAPQVRTVTSIAGTYPVGSGLTFSGAAVAWPIGAVVALGVVDAVLRDYVITRVTMAEDTTVEVEGVPYMEEAFEAFEWGLEVGDVIPEVGPPEDLPAGEAVTTVEAHQLPSGRTLLTWSPPPELSGQEARVYVRTPAVQTWDLVYQGRGASVELDRLEPGVALDVLVVAAGLTGPGAGLPVASAVSLTPDEFPASSPPPPAGLASWWNGERLVLAWQPVDGAELYEVRQGPYWGGARVLARTLEPRAELELPVGVMRLHVRSVAAGVPSGEDTSIEVVVPDPEGLSEVVETDVLEEVL